MPVTPRTPPGVLELLPPQQLAFQHLLDTVRRGFERFGFLPVETPVFELTDVLLTKSGGETEKQVYFVQSTGALNKEAAGLPELAMRFDLTVPLARYVAEHESELNFPFRRYQIQRVYRGERAQKGRYREFYQCDIDVIGKDSLPLAYDAEVPAVIYGIFRELAFGPFTIYINNRKLLRGILETLGFAEAEHATVLHEIDRIGKQHIDDVEASLVGNESLLSGDEERLNSVGTLFNIFRSGSSLAAFDAVRALPSPTPTLTEGLAELEQVYAGTRALGVPERALQVKLSIARGLDYYTGTIYETFLDDHPKLGSICSGGRYENLAGHYTKSKLPGVGISIGATRLFSQLLERNVIQATRAAVAHVLVLAVEPALSADCAQMAAELREAGLNVEVYGGYDKLGKQLKYADRGKVPVAILYGSREKDAGIVKVKDLRETAATKEHDVPRADLALRIKQLVG